MRHGWHKFLCCRDESLSRKAAAGGFLLLVLSVFCPSVFANPEDDRVAFVAYFESRFPAVPFEEYANGIYAIDSDAREQWQEIEAFPPYEFNIDRGKSLWNETFTDGRTYADCFNGAGPGVRHLYPRYDVNSGEVQTLETAINRCREQHGQTLLGYDGEEMLSLTAYMAFESRGQRIAVSIPPDQRGALDAYQEGQRFYYTKRGQLNFACSDCHVTSAGQFIRADRLSASLGHPTHFPVYRSKTGGMVSLHQRFSGCVRDVRAKPFELQSREFRNLEFFLSYMSNGLEVNGPGSRK